MFKNKTVLILGAGASFEAGLPIGDTLKAQIAEALQVRESSRSWGDFHLADQSVSDAVKLLNRRSDSRFSWGEIITACKQIGSALPLARSIDNFLHSNQHSVTIEFCGKLGIVSCILKAERESLLKIADEQAANAGIDFSGLKDKWYNRFAALMFESTFDDLRRSLENLTVISFNYDRCFEHFMYYSIITYYGRSPQEAAEVVNGMKVFHPYGMVGYLPWMERSPMAKFGDQVDAERLLQLAGQIKTYTEGVDRESSEIQAIHSALRKALNVIFLGFGYIPLNMDLLRPNEDSDWTKVSTQQKQYWGTAYRLSDEDTNVVTSKVKSLVQTGFVHAKINNKVTCANLFTEYGFTLSGL